ncbi:MAG: LCP family protein [Patescibacteria group bacterium]|nr:LCP family protein [Patescibacteria group bacterium]
MEENKINLLQPNNPIAQNEPPKKKKKIFLYFFILIILTFFALGADRLAAMKQDSSSAGETLQPKKFSIFSSVKNFIFRSDNEGLVGQNKDRINILLLGMGGAGHDGPYLTDTDIILSIQPSTQSVAMISIPRDLSVPTDEYGWRKINFLNALNEVKYPGEGGEKARQAFVKIFDLEIPYYVRVDFQAFKEIIDAVGGIDINAPNAFQDTMYPAPDKTYQTISFTEGLQHLDGEKSLQYARSRHGSNGESSDFARARRQQQVLTALKEKMLSWETYLNPVRIQKILNSLSTHISSNLDLNHIMSLAAIGRNINKEIKTLVLDNNTDGYLVSSITSLGAFILSPKTGNFDEINQAIKNVFIETEKEITPVAQEKSKFPTARIELQNGTWRAGLAMEKKKMLEELGFFITYVGNSVKRPNDNTIIYLINPAVDNETVAALKNHLKARVATVLPEWLGPNYNDTGTSENETGPKYQPDTEILIILGNDNAK